MHRCIGVRYGKVAVPELRADAPCHLEVYLLFQCMHALIPTPPLLTTTSLPT